MEYLEIVSVPLIAVIVYWFINLLKAALKKTKDFEKFKQFIPFISAMLGAALGIVAFYTAPQIIAASNVFVAVLSGGASGLAATGCHQCMKQFSKPDNVPPTELEAGADKDAENEEDKSVQP